MVIFINQIRMKIGVMFEVLKQLQVEMRQILFSVRIDIDELEQLKIEMRSLEIPRVLKL